MAIRRLVAYVWRFQTLQIADRMAADVDPGQIVDRSFERYRLYLDVSRSNAQRLLYLEGARFIGERELFQALLGSDMCVVDIGANIGYYMLMTHAIVGEGGQVICFEPDTDNLRELKLNVERNRLDNVKIVQAAVGQDDAMAQLNPGLNAMVSSSGTQPVRLVRLDTAVATHVDVIKIDVEGYEGHVLAGAQRIIEEHRPAIFLEMHPSFLVDYTQEEIISTLKKYYSNISFSAIDETAGTIAKKLGYRYFGISYIKSVEESETSYYHQHGLTYWIICKPEAPQSPSTAKR